MFSNMFKFKTAWAWMDIWPRWNMRKVKFVREEFWNIYCFRVHKIGLGRKFKVYHACLLVSSRFGFPPDDIQETWRQRTFFTLNIKLQNRRSRRDVTASKGIILIQSMKVFLRSHLVHLSMGSKGAVTLWTCLETTLL